MGPKFNFKSFEKKLGFKNDIKWSTSVLIVFYHVFGVYWCWKYAFPCHPFTVLFAIFMFFINGMGITCAAHRLFTHRSYKVIFPLKVFLVICQASAGQNSVYAWVRDHRLHHKFSDTEADPHNANRGLFFSHIGWLMTKKNEEVKEKGKKINMSDIENDRLLMFQHKYFILFKLLFCYILPTITGIYLWGENWRCAVAWQCFIRYLVMLHNELTVNSLAHAYGYTPYNKNIIPKENLFVATTTFGEGWHNYHHVFPFDYKAAEHFDKLNLSASMIRWWAKMGWAYDLKEATPAMVKATIEKYGDGLKSVSDE